MKTNNEQKEITKFTSDKALERVNDLYSCMNLFFNVAMAFSAEAESIMDMYRVRIREIKYATNRMNKEYDNFCSVMNDFYGGDDGMKRFASCYDKMVDDMYRYCSIPKVWKAGDEINKHDIGAQNLLDYAKENKGSKDVYRFIGRNKEGQLYITMKIGPKYKEYAIPNEWFKTIKKGEFTKVKIEPLMKF